MNSVDSNGSATKIGGAPANSGDSQLLHSSLMALAHANGDGEAKGPPGLSATPTLTGLLQSLRRRWLLALCLSVGLVAATVAGVFVVNPPKYNVTLRIRVVAKQAGADDVEFPIFKANMEAMVRNPIVLSNALNDKTADGRDIKDLDLVRKQGMGAIDWLERNLKTDYLLGPEVLRVTLPSNQPEDAAELLNAIKRAFLNEYTEMERSKKQGRLAELRAKKEVIERDLHSLRGALERLLGALNHKDRDQANVQQGVLVGRLNAAIANKRNLDDEIAKAKAEIINCEARLKSLGKLEVPDNVLFDFYSKDLIITEYQKRIVDIEREISDAYRKFNEPFASQVATPLKHERLKIDALKTKQEAKLRPDIEQRYRKQVSDDLKFRIEVANEKIDTNVPLSEKEQKNINDLDRQVQAAGAGNQNKPPQIAAVEQSIELARMSLNHTTQRISEVELEPIVSRLVPLQNPVVPQEKDFSRQTKIGGAGGLAVLLLTLFGVGLFEFRSRRIGLPDEVSSGLGINVVGTIPAMPPRVRKPTAKDEAAEQKWLAELQESVDAIRTVLLHQARAEALHVLMVTSAQSGEGKTTLATQLAASLARAWKRTLVIDADLRHPGAHTLFDVPQEPGLAEVLRGEVEPADAVRATAVSRLWLLPAGNGDAHAIQALAQDNLRTLFEQLKQQYDFIIIDTPPILPVADSLLIGQHVDGVLYAVLREVSRAPAVYAAQQKMAPLGVHMLGAVVLGAQKEFDDKSYGYVMNPAAK